MPLSQEIIDSMSPDVRARYDAQQQELARYSTEQQRRREQLRGVASVVKPGQDPGVATQQAAHEGAGDLWSDELAKKAEAVGATVEELRAENAAKLAVLAKLQEILGLRADAIMVQDGIDFSKASLAELKDYLARKSST